MPSKDQDAPLDRAATKMVEFYRKYRDVYKAAERAHVPKNQAVRLFNSAAFQEELDRQEEAVRMERARQEVRDEKLTNETIDRELLQVMLLPAEIQCARGEHRAYLDSDPGGFAGGFALRGELVGSQSELGHCSAPERSTQ